MPQCAVQAEVAQLQQQLEAATAAAEEAGAARQAAEASAAQQGQRQEADVEALVRHHAEEVRAGVWPCVRCVAVLLSSGG